MYIVMVLQSWKFLTIPLRLRLSFTLGIDEQRYS